MKFNLKLIDNISIEGVDWKDHPDYVDAFVGSADYDGVPMTPEQLDALNDNYFEWVHEKVLEG